jgi:hypothetical protein
MANLRVTPAALVVWMTLLNTGVSYAADKIILLCSGTVYPKEGTSWHPGNESLVIDLDRQIVSESLTVDFLGELPISVSEDTMYLEGTSLLDYHVHGSINRVTGETLIYTSDEEYRGTCKPAEPLF